jgi:N12 class adenine-specific DNA methylase
MFDDVKADWAGLRDQLRATLSAEDWKAARAGVLNAHYTHPAYIHAIWAALSDMGLTHGHVLEPGCGVGTFIGLAPEGVHMSGVELDATSARIAQALYPSAEIRAEGYQSTPTTHLFDGAVGNVPFGDIRLYDPASNPGNHTIHNHFTIKALSQTKPGGLVALLSSHYTLDALNPAARRDMHERADLLGAIRLPSGAHSRMADTEAVTDLLVFRVRKPGEEPQPFTWEHAHKQTLPGSEQPVIVSDYMMANPARVLGTMGAGQGMYGATNLLVDGPQGTDLARTLSERLALLGEAAAGKGLTYDPEPAAQTPALDTTIGEDQALIGSVREQGEGSGVFERLTESGWSELSVPKTQQAELRALLDLRDQVRTLLDMESSTSTDTPALGRARARLADAYHSYREHFGALNRNTKSVKVTEVKHQGQAVVDEATGEVEVEERVSVRRPPVMSRFFGKDPHAALTRAIEIYDEDTGSAEDAPILHSRQVFARYTPKGADTPADALAISQETKGSIELDYVAYLLGLDTAQAAREALGDLVFDTPDGHLEARAAYLSGNVRRKLHTATQAAESDPAFQVNVQALESVVPRDLGVADISPSPGAPWIPTSDHAAFISEALDIRRPTVTYNPVEGWKVEAFQWGTAQTATWGTLDKSATSIFQDMLNNKAIQVTRRETDAEGRPHDVFDARASEAARAKAEDIEARFKEWIWQDPARTTRLLGDYNERFNSLVPRTYDSAGEQLRLPGLASTFTLRDHQKAAIARMIAEPTCGLFHEVGAGKTLEMVCGVMEQKRLGLITKAMVVVPNHMLAQFEREWLQAYPHAHILAADPDDISNRSGRGDFMARVTTSDWDAVIVTQEAFKRIGVSGETRAQYNNQRLDELDAWMATSSDQRSVQAAEKKRQTLLNRLQRDTAKAEEKEDAGVIFEQLGVDYLVVDEAHGYKNLSAPTELKGIIAQASAAKVRDLDMKLAWLRRTHGARVAAFATATPIANTMGEMWVMNHYLRPDLLHDAGLDTFDAWAKTFTGIDTRVESTVGGKLKVRQRIARFQNMPELMTMWATFADVKTRDQLDLLVPSLTADAQGRQTAQVLTVDVGSAMGEFQQAIAIRAERIEQGAVEPQVDNWLAITNDGRAMSTDYRLLTGRSADRAFHGVTSPIGEQKVDRAADEIARIYHATKDTKYRDDQGHPSMTPGALQMVFCDQGTPKKEQWNLYDELKHQLSLRGVPEEAIAFAHDAKNTVEKDRLFARARTGAVNVLIGSTEKMGTGANMQARAIALHHLTAPWRPADLAQRDGRIIRQGNQNDQVSIFRYVTEGSFDTYMWQTLERKAAFINQVMSGTLTGRDVADADISEEEASYAQVKAIASGNPLIMEEARLKNDVSRFKTRSDAFDAQQRYLQAQHPQLDRQLAILATRIDLWDGAATRVTPTAGDAFRMRINGVEYSQRNQAAEEFAQLFRDMRTERFSPLYPNPSSATDYRRRGMSEVRMTLGGHELRLGVRPQELDLYGQPNTDKPTYFTASIEGLRDDDAYWSQGGPTFTLTDLDTTAGVVGLIRKIENHVHDIPTQAERLRANAETTREERERISAELDKSNPWIQRLHEARDHLAAVHQQMESAQTGQDTIPELSAAPHTIVRGAPAGPERTRGILSTATTDLTPRPTQGRPTGQHANSTNDLRPTLH